MKINNHIRIEKHNQELIGKGELCFEDYIITLYSHDIISRMISIRAENQNNEKLKLTLRNVLQFSISSYNSVYDDVLQIKNWTTIPSKDFDSPFYDDSFLLDAKKNSSVNRWSQWEDNLLAVGFLLSDGTEMKFICRDIFIGGMDIDHL